MADEVDLANEATERQVAMSLANLQPSVESRLKQTGKCHWCDEALEQADIDNNKKFCQYEGADCAEYFDRELKLRKINGR